MNSTTPESDKQPAPRPVTVAVLTYQREQPLRRAVQSMASCAIPGSDAGWFLKEILVVDNNPTGSAREAVSELDAESDVAVAYTHEPEPGIVPARNRALTDATGDVLVFIDDDEIALPGWPDGLLQVMERTGAALVGGPVISEFVEEPAQWVRDSGFFDRPPRQDGSEPTWLHTGNLAIDLVKIRRFDLRFDARYPHGEDAAFSRLAASHGLGLRWSATASVKEFIEPERTTVSWRNNRHRISTDAWVRSDLDLDPSVRMQSTIIAKAAYRFAEGLVTAIAGTVLRNRAKRYSGLALVAQARGGIDGIVTFYRTR